MLAGFDLLHDARNCNRQHGELHSVENKEN
jgi:hypothetical protein